MLLVDPSSEPEDRRVPSRGVRDLDLVEMPSGSEPPPVADDLDLLQLPDVGRLEEERVHLRIEKNHQAAKVTQQLQLHAEQCSVCILHCSASQSRLRRLQAAGNR